MAKHNWVDNSYKDGMYCTKCNQSDSSSAASEPCRGIEAMIEQHVQLIASGYEFECQCGVLNRVSAVPHGNLGEDGKGGCIVTCKSCGADLVVDDYHHAID